MAVTLFLVQDGWLDQIMAILFMLSVPFKLQGRGLWCCASVSTVKGYHSTGRDSVRVAKELMRVTGAACDGQFLRASLTLKDLMVLKSLMEICEHMLMNSVSPRQEQLLCAWELTEDIAAQQAGL